MIQQKETTKTLALADISDFQAAGRIVALDPGTKRCGVAVCDEMRVTTRPLPFIAVTSWKNLLAAVKEIVREFDARALVIGLPLESDGSESTMSAKARDWHRKFTLSLDVPAFLQDERVTTYEAKARLWQKGVSLKQTRTQIDSEAATIILVDFLDRIGPKPKR